MLIVLSLLLGACSLSTYLLAAHLIGPPFPTLSTAEQGAAFIELLMITELHYIMSLYMPGAQV